MRRIIDAKVDALIREHLDLFFAICSDLEAKQVLTREELLSSKGMYE